MGVRSLHHLAHMNQQSDTEGDPS